MFSRSRTCSESSEGGPDHLQQAQTGNLANNQGATGARPIPGRHPSQTGSTNSTLSSSADSYLSQSPNSGGGFLAGFMGARGNAAPTAELVGYDLEGKFTYNQVLKSQIGAKLNKTTIDENGKFDYISSDMRPVPPGWYDLDKSKHKVPMGWYDVTKK